MTSVGNLPMISDSSEDPEVEKARLEAQRAEDERKAAEAENEREHRQQQMMRYTFRLMQEVNGNEEHADASPPSDFVNADTTPPTPESATDAMYRTGVVEGSIEPIPPEPADITVGADVAEGSMGVGSSAVGAGTEVATEVGAGAAGAGVAGAEMAADAGVAGAEMAVGIAEVLPEAAMLVVAL